MNRFEELEDEASILGIEVIDTDIPIPEMNAAYLNLSGVERIFLRNSGTVRERACWIAEELGHHHTGQKQVLRYRSIDDWRAEVRARRWAHMRLLTPDAIYTAARNTDDMFEIAEALDVSEEFLRESIDDFQSNGIWSSTFVSVGEMDI
jgi:hypothetical protein